MPKIALLILSFLFVGRLFAQQHEKFEFWISDLDKAAYNRITYHITSNKIIVKEGPYDFIYFDKNYKKDKVVFQKQLDSLSSVEFYKIASNIKDDSLKSSYSNICILDGMIINFLFEWRDGTKKSTMLSNYYLEKMQPFVDFVNNHVTEKYQILYNKTEIVKLMNSGGKDCILD